MCASVSSYGSAGRRADHVEAELGGTSCELGGRHARIVPVKAIRIHEDGGPEVLRYEDVPDPEPGEGEVLVRLAAASLNHLDVWVRKGLPSVPKPRILGADGAGVVEALGRGRRRLRGRRPRRDQPRDRARRTSSRSSASTATGRTAS